MDLMERAGDLKQMLVEFALSPHFKPELSAVIAQKVPADSELLVSTSSMVIDYFALQHRLPSGNKLKGGFSREADGEEMLG